MAWFIVQSLFVILLAFLLGLLVGRLAGMRRRHGPEPALDLEVPGHYQVPVQYPVPAQAELPAEVELAARIGLPTEIELPAEAELPAQFELLTEVDLPVTPAEPAQPRPVSPAPTAADRLERIEGIGPKIANALRAAGITTFASLAAADEHTLREALHAAGLRFAPSLPTWPGQARLLADGNEAGFAELTAGLVGGRDTSGVS